MVLQLEKMYWHVPVDPRYHPFLAVQVGRTVLKVHSPSLHPERCTMCLNEDDKSCHTGSIPSGHRGTSVTV